MSRLFINIKIFSSFWILLACYFIIPIFITPINPPNWFYSIDIAIPFIWWMIIPYYIYYIIILLPPLIWDDEWQIRNITSTLNILSIICYLFFILWPIDASYVLNVPFNTLFPLKEFHNLITYGFLYQNAFPSMHVAVSSFLCLSYYYNFKQYRLLAIISALLIFLATFLIKQHYFFDSIMGLLMGCLGFYYYQSRTKTCK